MEEHWSQNQNFWLRNGVHQPAKKGDLLVCANLPAVHIGGVYRWRFWLWLFALVTCVR